MPKEVVGGSTILRRHDDGKEIELKQPAPGYATIFRYVRKITGSSDDERGRVRVVQTNTEEWMYYAALLPSEVRGSFIVDRQQTTSESSTLKQWNSRMWRYWIRSGSRSRFMALIPQLFCSIHPRPTHSSAPSILMKWICCHSTWCGDWRGSRNKSSTQETILVKRPTWLLRWSEKRWRITSCSQSMHLPSKRGRRLSIRLSRRNSSKTYTD